MSYVVTAPHLLELAATDFGAIASAVDAARAAAAPRTLTLLPAAADEVSASVARLFAQHADEYQKVAGQAAAFHSQFVQQLTVSACAYTSAESANAALLHLENAGPASAAAGDASWDAVGIALNNFINTALDRIVLFLIWPLLIPAFLYYLPFYVTLSRFFPTVFPTADLWKVFFFPFIA